MPFANPSGGSNPIHQTTVTHTTDPATGNIIPVYSTAAPIASYRVSPGNFGGTGVVTSPRGSGFTLGPPSAGTTAPLSGPGGPAPTTGTTSTCGPCAALDNATGGHGTEVAVLLGILAVVVVLYLVFAE